MRKGFTLIELMIVIAIIAIIAAIAIPNLLESRIASNEAAAGTTLKSGIFPAEVQFQAGGYADDAAGLRDVATPPTGIGGNGIGDFAAMYAQMAGGDILTGDTDPGTNPPLSLLPSSWNAVAPVVNSYVFGIGSNNELGFGAGCYPSDQADSIGRRCFAINAAGVIFATAPSATNASTLVGSAAGLASAPFGATNYKAFVTAGWSQFKR